MTPTLRRTAQSAVLVLTAAALAACGSNPVATPAHGSGGGSSTITIGSANFSESELLMDIYGKALEGVGVKVTYKPEIGSREVYMQAFKQGSLDLLPEYTGALLDYLEPNGTPKGVSSPASVFTELKKAAPAGSEVLPYAPAQDVDTITVTKQTAQKYHLSSIADLAPVASKLTVGAGAEWKGRYQGLLGLKQLYGVTFGTFKALDSGGPLTIAALKNGDVDAADVFSTDPDIAENHWVSLSDPKSLFLAENIVPLISKAKATPKVTQALDAVDKVLTTQTLAKLDAQVGTDKQDPQTVATQFLSDNNLK